jgi:hypothetical protein
MPMLRSFVPYGDSSSPGLFVAMTFTKSESDENDTEFPVGVPSPAHKPPGESYPQQITATMLSSSPSTSIWRHYDYTITRTEL